MTKEQLLSIAIVVHEANRALCLANGDPSQVPWDLAPQWQKDSTFNSVEAAIRGETPQKLHEIWVKEKEDSGWTYGPVKDPLNKQHDCLVPYDQLPDYQKAKDKLFIDVVQAMVTALKAKE